MKKILLAILLIGIISSCTETNSIVDTKSTPYFIQRGNSNIGKQLKTCVIEHCEYFVCFNRYGNSLCHKGNCSNPIHKGGDK